MGRQRLQCDDTGPPRKARAAFVGTASTKEQLDALVAEVAARVNSERGEAIFRRAELNCVKCHAVSGAAGGVGPGDECPRPQLTDRLRRQLEPEPDQAIEEEFQTRVVLTDDGRVLQGIVVEEDDEKFIL